MRLPLWIRVMFGRSSPAPLPDEGSETPAMAAREETSGVAGQDSAGVTTTGGASPPVVGASKGPDQPRATAASCDVEGAVRSAVRGAAARELGARIELLDLMREILLSDGQPLTAEKLERKAEAFTQIGEERTALSPIAARIAQGFRRKAADLRELERRRTQDARDLITAASALFGRGEVARVCIDALIDLARGNRYGKAGLYHMAAQLRRAADRMPEPQGPRAC